MEVLANLGVLVGKIFLTIEVSQNTAATKSQASMAVSYSLWLLLGFGIYLCA